MLPDNAEVGIISMMADFLIFIYITCYTGQNFDHINLFQTGRFHFYKFLEMKKMFLIKVFGHSVTSFHILFSGSTIGCTPKERNSKIDFGDLCR